MNRKKPDITQEICDQVKFLIKGGATNRKAGRFVGLSASTVSRIRTADYDVERYRKNNEIRNAEEKQSLVPDYFTKDAIKNVSPEYIEDKEQPGLFNLKLTQHEASDQVPGQMAMDLKGVTEKLKDCLLTAGERTLLQKAEQMVYDNQLKISKAVYTSADRIGAHLNKTERYMQEAGGMLTDISLKLDKLNDNLCQILRRMDK